MTRLVTGLALGATAAVMAPAWVRAQTLSGTLLRADSTPAAGVIVAAIRGARDSVVARVMTNGNGRYVMEVSAGAVRLRALRIGHRPVMIGEWTLERGARRETRTVLPDDPILLQAMTTEASSSCKLSGGAGANVATVFEEARKALLSTTLRSRDGDPLVRLSTSTQLRSVGNRELSPLERVFSDGISLKPFQSLNADSLAKIGYMQSEGTGQVYWAPDAEVLLSETFASTHCLGLVAGKDQQAGWIGLTFRPQSFRRDFVDISGTLWLDRATSELRRMEYSYEGLPLNMQRVAPGGVVEFTRLPEGTWFVNRWEIRMPRMTLPPAAPRLAGVYVRGGEVWRMQRGGALLYTNGLEEPKRAARAERETDDATAHAMPADDSLCALPRGASGGGLLSGAVRDERGATVPAAEVTVAWQESHTAVGNQLAWQTRTLRTVAGSDGAYAACGIPDARLLTVSAQYGRLRSAPVSVRVGAGERRATVDVLIAGVRAEVVGRGVVLRVTDAFGVAIPHALVSVDGGRGRVADDSGRVSLEATTDSLRVDVRRIGFSPFNGRVGRGANGEMRVELRPLAQALATVTVVARGASTSLERTGFYERVQRAQRSAMVGEFITPEELESRNLSRVTDMLQGRQYSSLKVIHKDGRNLSVVLGRAGCVMNVVVDGQPLKGSAQELQVSNVPTSINGAGSASGSMGTSLDLDDLINGRSVMGVEIYPSIANAPAELIPTASRGGCGLVVIWTGGRH